ncbi:MAG: hypothetical protein ACREIR_02995 [Geminicoccaceae bacterium]
MRAKVAAVLLLFVLARPAAAQQQEGDPAAGQKLASQLCAACHIVGAERVGSDVAPPFATIAKDPDVTRSPNCTPGSGRRTPCCPTSR